MCDDRHRSPPSRWPNSRPPSKPLPQNRRRHRPVTTRPPHKRRNEEEARDPKAGPPTTNLLGSSAVSIARLAAAIAVSLPSDVPDFVPVSVSTDHFQRPRLMPWMIRYSTPRCSMLMHRAKEER